MAAIRQSPITVKGTEPLPGNELGSVIAPGQTHATYMRLHPGRWFIGVQYMSGLPVRVTAPGLSETIPAVLDRVGPRWPVGTITVRPGDRAPVAVSFNVHRGWLTYHSENAVIGDVVATPMAPERVVPLRTACGDYVDWYRVT